MKAITGLTLMRAYLKAVRKMDRDKAGELVESCESVGLVIPDGQQRGHRQGHQVFMDVCRYSDEVLASNPMSGGLLVRDP